MKVALPIWDQHISPVFDVARTIRVVEVEDGDVVGTLDHRIAAGSHASLLSDLGVEVLICSAISHRLEALLQGTGVAVISDICGDVSEVVAAYVHGRLTDGRFASPCHSHAAGRDRSDRSGGRSGRATATHRARRSHPRRH